MTGGSATVRWVVVLAIMLPLGVPSVSANGVTTNGQLMIDGALELSGEIVWAGTGPLASLSAPQGSAGSLSVHAAQATVHVWKWERLRAETGVVDQEHWTDLSTARHDYQDVRLEASFHDPGAALTLASDDAQIVATSPAGDLFAARTLHATVDPRLAGRFERDGFPHDHHRSDVVAATLKNAAIRAEGDMRVSLWNTTVQLVNEDGERRFESGMTAKRAPNPIANVSTVDHGGLQLVWVEVRGAVLFVTHGGHAVLGAEHVHTTLNGTFAGRATGGLMTDGDPLTAQHAPLSARGAFDIAVRLDRAAPVDEAPRGATIQPYTTTNVEFSGDATGLAVAGRDLLSSEPALSLGQQAAIGAAAVALVLAALRYGSTVLAFLLTRVNDDAALDQPTRQRIFEAVRAHPGILTAQISAVTATSYGTTRYHLRILEKSGYISKVWHHSAHRFHENHGKWDDIAALVATLSNPKAATLVDLIARHASRTQDQLIEATGLPQSTISFHLKGLLKVGAIEKIKESGKRMNSYTATSRLRDAIARLEQNTDSACGIPAPHNGAVAAQRVHAEG